MEKSEKQSKNYIEKSVKQHSFYMKKSVNNAKKMWKSQKKFYYRIKNVTFAEK